MTDDDIQELADNLLLLYIHAINITQTLQVDKLLQSRNVQQHVHRFFQDQPPAFQFRNYVERLLCTSETFRIINDLILNQPAADNTGIDGRMKVIRVTDKACGNRLYRTLTIARKLGSNRIDYFFEILRYFDSLKLSNSNISKPVTRIWQVLQRNKCSYFDIKGGEVCTCNAPDNAV